MKLPRQVNDRSAWLAYVRWHCLRRTVGYPATVSQFISLGAQSHGWIQDRFLAHCRAGGGVVDPPADAVGAAMYDAALKRWGVQLLVLPDVEVSVEQMKCFPIFTDTPTRQPEVKDREVLQQLAHRMDISWRDLRSAFHWVAVPPSGFRLPAKRLHLRTLERDLAVFDQRVKLIPFAVIASDLGISETAAWRAWRRATALIQDYALQSWESGVDDHIDQCATCRRYFTGRGEDPCPRLRRALALPGGPGRLCPKSDRAMELIVAGRNHDLPGRRRTTRPIAGHRLTGR